MFETVFLLQGTEYYDGKAKRYVDFPITDILQMMGRAGRPQFDQHGKAVILVHEPKKSFYKKVRLNIVTDLSLKRSFFWQTIVTLVFPYAVFVRTISS
jgi:superfamily II RNA helicase